MHPQCVSAYLARLASSGGGCCSAGSCVCEEVRAMRPFTSSAIPGVSVQNYSSRLIKFASVHEDWSSRCAGEGRAQGAEAGLACALIGRLADPLEQLKRQRECHCGGECCCGAKVIVSPYNVHRLFLASYVVAIKYLWDRPPSAFLRSMSTMGGVGVEELTRLEALFLSLISYDLYIDPPAFTCFCVTCCTQCVGAPFNNIHCSTCVPAGPASPVQVLQQRDPHAKQHDFVAVP
eukprot:TRINITY_DN4425_c0_g1_i2.p1 TRINITY_DN4425_c0_g1~~TRINITY_DN4425_c0_g1_i2.p1  ORF type:complete len:234 (+),score=56.72 TRINITY_DN4425_c0_g1_i2:50-751(+)